MRGVRANFTNLSVDMPPGKDAQGALGLAHAQQRPEKPRLTLALGGKTALYYLPLTIAEQLGVDIGEVTEEKSFIEDLNADSLDLTELIMTLEEKFDLTIADDQAEKLKTVKEGQPNPDEEM